MTFLFLLSSSFFLPTPREEICALVDRCLLNDDEDSRYGSVLAKELRKGFSDRGYAAAVPSRAERGAGNQDVSDDWEAIPTIYGVGCVRWIRRDLLSGGAAGLELLVGGEPLGDECDGAAAEIISCADAVQRMDIVALVFRDPSAFLGLLSRDAEAIRSDDYPLLRRWIDDIRRSLRTGFEARFHKDSEGRGGSRNRRKSSGLPKTSGSRILLVLCDVSGELSRNWNSRSREGAGRRRQRCVDDQKDGTRVDHITDSDLQDALVWLLTEEQVEYHQTANAEETAEYLLNLTRALSEAPYYEDATELHCIKKIKADAGASTPDEKVTDVWMRMLQQIPSMSEKKARRLVQRYPNMNSLVNAYEDPSLSEAERRELVSGFLVEGKIQKKLSDTLYRLMMTDEPNDQL